MGYAFDIWATASRNAALIAVISMVLGVALTAVSHPMGLHSDYFEGRAAGVEIMDFPDGLRKQVGYVWAPNWCLAGIFLMPMAIYLVLTAVGRAEDLLRELARTGMLLHRDYSMVDEGEVIELWHGVAKPFAWVALLTALLIGLYVAIFDLYPVVLKWLREDHMTLTNTMSSISLKNPVHEFDWSVASIFDGINLDRNSNAMFSIIAYAYIAIFGVSVIFGGFLYMSAICAFFGTCVGRNSKLILVPDLDSKDPRLGFERMEPLFHSFIIAAIATSILSVLMHLQNVFLRTKHETIIQMIFGDLISLYEKGKDVRVSDILDYPTRMDNLVPVGLDTATMQTYAAAVALAVIGFIVLSSLWLWLRYAAYEGRDILLSSGVLNPEQTGRLNKIKIWPVGWISLTILVFLGFIIFMCMWIINFTTLVLLYFVAKAVGILTTAIQDAIRDAFVSKSKK